MATVVEPPTSVSVKGRILIVDDDERIRKAMSMVLTSEGYVVDTVQDGKQAIEKSETNFYNVALVDIRLPDMHGTELLTQMQETTPRMIKIIITGYASLQNAIEAVNNGADGYLTKPVEVNRLLAMITDQLRKQQELRDYGEDKIMNHIQTRFKEIETTKPATESRIE